MDCLLVLATTCLGLGDLDASVFELRDMYHNTLAATHPILAGSRVRLVSIKDQITVVHANIPLTLDAGDNALVKACEFFGVCVADHYLHPVYRSTFHLVRQVQVQKAEPSTVGVIVQYQSQTHEFTFGARQPASAILSTARRYFNVSGSTTLNPLNISAIRTLHTGVICDFALFELCPIVNVSLKTGYYLMVHHVKDEQTLVHQVPCDKLGMASAALLKRVCHELHVDEETHELLCRDCFVHPKHVIHAGTEQLRLRRKLPDNNPF